jgi:ubiquinone/menaquinone biosynthesis C-methylase UbiE
MNKFIEKFIKNVKKPDSNLFGRAQLKAMNSRHNPLALWGMSHLDFSSRLSILDVGCGGGKNIENMLVAAPRAKVFGADYSQQSVETSLKKNAKAVACGRAEIVKASAESLPFEDGRFDTVTAFETVYFWRLKEAFCEVFRVLAPSGKFLIVNEAQNEKGLEQMMSSIGFNVYTAEQLEEALENVGFEVQTVDKHENGKWLALAARKPE